MVKSNQLNLTDSHKQANETNLKIHDYIFQTYILAPNKTNLACITFCVAFTIYFWCNTGKVKGI